MTPGFLMKNITLNIIIDKYVANNIVHLIMFYCMPHNLNNFVKHQKDKKSMSGTMCDHRVQYKASLRAHMTDHHTLWTLYKIFDYKIQIQNCIDYKLGHVEYINTVFMFL